MSRQIQIRRGTAAEHETFTGAIGEVTMDTTNNTLRVHDGVTAGGVALARADAVAPGAVIPDSYDFVIDSYRSADGTTWYRKYKSGWVEQGGIIAKGSAADLLIVFPVRMADTRYNWQLTCSYNSTNTPSYRVISCWNFTTDGMTVRVDPNFDKSWSVCGVIESGV